MNPLARTVKIFLSPDFLNMHLHMGTAVAQWLRCCATNRKVAGSIPAGVNGPGVDSAFNGNEYQEHFLGLNAAGA